MPINKCCCGNNTDPCFTPCCQCGIFNTADVTGTLTIVGDTFTSNADIFNVVAIDYFVCPPDDLRWVIEKGTGSTWQAIWNGQTQGTLTSGSAIDTNLYDTMFFTNKPVIPWLNPAHVTYGDQIWPPGGYGIPIPDEALVRAAAATMPTDQPVILDIESGEFDDPAWIAAFAQMIAWIKDENPAVTCGYYLDFWASVGTDLVATDSYVQNTHLDDLDYWIAQTESRYADAAATMLPVYIFINPYVQLMDLSIVELSPDMWSGMLEFLHSRGWNTLLWGGFTPPWPATSYTNWWTITKLYDPANSFCWPTDDLNATRSAWSLIPGGSSPFFAPDSLFVGSVNCIDQNATASTASTTSTLLLSGIIGNFTTGAGFTGTLTTTPTYPPWNGRLTYDLGSSAFLPEFATQSQWSIAAIGGYYADGINRGDISVTISTTSSPTGIYQDTVETQVNIFPLFQYTRRAGSWQGAIPITGNLSIIGGPLYVTVGYAP